MRVDVYSYSVPHAHLHAHVDVRMSAGIGEILSTDIATPHIRAVRNAGGT